MSLRRRCVAAPRLAQPIRVLYDQLHSQSAGTSGPPGASEHVQATTPAQLSQPHFNLDGERWGCHKDRCRKSFLPSARALFHTSDWLRLSALHVVKCSVCLIFTTCIFCSSTLILLLKLSNKLSVYSVLFKTALWYNYQKSGKAHNDWSFKTPFAAPCWWVVGSPDILIFRCRQMKRWGLGLGLG